MKPVSVKIHSVIAVLLAVILIAANVAMYLTFDLLTKLTNNMGLQLNSEELPTVQAEALELTHRITEEGMVLLRNERNALPLAEGANVNLFGWSSTALVVGGSGGSGGASGVTVDLKDSLEAAGFHVNDALLEMYHRFKERRDTAPEPEYGGYSPSWGTPEPEISDETYYTKDLLKSARDFSDTALVTISRTSGEGLDIPEGYLSLTDAEKNLIAYLRETYQTVVVIINANSAMELQPLEEMDVDAILFMPGPGAEGAISLGRILNGSVNPSGRLVDTFAYDHKSAPNYYYANRPGTMEYSDKPGYYYVDYVEGIYVGYRYYETAAAEEFLDYDTVVQYPFGYGLSYTTFEQQVVDVKGTLKSSEITVSVKVTNTGDRAGKEVVQLYVTPPYEKGGIEKAFVNLAGFGKTKLLEPQESETLTISVNPYWIASYDWNDANGDGRTGYVLEHGQYELKLMQNAHELITVAATFRLDQDVFFDRDPVTGTPIVNLFDDAAGADETEPVAFLSRADFAETFPKKKSSNIGRTASAAVKAADALAHDDDPQALPIVQEAKNGTVFADVIGKEYDDPVWDQLLDNLSFKTMKNLITSGAYATIELRGIKLDATVHTDGPQGISAWIIDVYGVNYPVQMYVAMTWNTELARQEGELFGREARASGVSALYAPATNIHRTPYSGRNFEYYAEDGYLSGMMAAQTVFGGRSEGLVTYVKHFALNDQETYRGEFFTSLFTWCNEQAMREIYLRPFELAVKIGKTTGIMSSFNRIGATWAGASKPLLTQLLREEWGFVGTVQSDMFISYNNEWWMNAEQGIRAGQDMWLSMYSAGALKLDKNNPTTLQQMRRATKNILYTLSQSRMSPSEMKADWFYHLALPLDLVCIAAWIGYVVFIAVKIRKQKASGKKA